MRNQFLLYISLFLCYFSPISCLIYQVSYPGQNGAMNFTSALQGGEYECGTLLAQSQLTTIDTTVTFNGNAVYSSFPSDMFLLIYDDKGSCLQYGGYNDNVTGCQFAGKWPTSWNSHTPGTYHAVADLTKYGFTGSSWQICIGNGYIQQPTPDPDDVYFTGHLDFSSSLITTSLVPSPEPTHIPTPLPSITFQPTGSPIVPTTPVPTFSQAPSVLPTRRPTSIPTTSMMPTADPFTLLSTCEHNPTLTISYATQLSGKQYVCSDFYSEGVLNIINITLAFSGSTTEEFPYDMLLVIYLIEANLGLQVGGFDLKYSDSLTYVGTWPDSWKTTASGIYKAEIDVSQYNLNGTGMYRICMMNGWKFAKKVSYSGLLVLPALHIDCPIIVTESPTFSPSLISTSAPTPLKSTDAPTHFPPASEAPSISPTTVDEKQNSKSADDDESFFEGSNLFIVVPIIVVFAVLCVGGIFYWNRLNSLKKSKQDENNTTIQLEKNYSLHDDRNAVIPVTPFVSNPLSNTI